MYHESVVNCFQFCIFAVLFTTHSCILLIALLLWIAFNFVSLQCYLQLIPAAIHPTIGCELLSILYLCSVIYNLMAVTLIMKRVVNCFQFCIFAVLFTTMKVPGATDEALWIAFNFVSLQCYLQQSAVSLITMAGCELLSILYLCSVIYNMRIWMHNLTQLWIAFNFVSLQCYLQRMGRKAMWCWCCELLSILYLCSVIYNESLLNIFVLCSCELLSILYLCSVIYNSKTYVDDFRKLWIAFNFVSLQCYLQPF